MKKINIFIIIFLIIGCKTHKKEQIYEESNTLNTFLNTHSLQNLEQNHKIRRKKYTDYKYKIYIDKLKEGK